MRLRKLRISITAGIAAAGILGSLVIEHLTDIRLREDDAVLHEQADQLAKLALEHQRLSNLLAQADNSPAYDQTSELVKLRAEAEALRKQADELRNQQAENLRSQQPQVVSKPNSRSREYYDQMAAGKIDDAKTFIQVLRKYASEHQGEFPSNFDQVAPYLPKTGVLLTGTNAFDIIFQGSLNDLTNVSLRAAALIREQQAWLTPSGNWARVYGYADGWASIVECDDNFESWETEHIIPPPTAGQ
jgi:hypothetical protein